MASSVYSINKGANAPIVFKGLKAQYIWYLGGGLVGLLLLFAILYLAGVNTYLCLVLILVAGSLLFSRVYKLSNKYGEHGMMKKAAKRMLPKLIRSNSRRLFMK
jgi:4-hydroxybenzoate polyprenyltransferase